MIESDGWDYSRDPSGEGDGRKFVTLVQDGMTWVGIRHWQSAVKRWVNNGEPIAGERVLAWRDLPQPAKGFWQAGKIYILPNPWNDPAREYDSWGKSFVTTDGKANNQ